MVAPSDKEEEKEFSLKFVMFVRMSRQQALEVSGVAEGDIRLKFSVSENFSTEDSGLGVVVESGYYGFPHQRAGRGGWRNARRFVGRYEDGQNIGLGYFDCSFDEAVLQRQHKEDRFLRRRRLSGQLLEEGRQT